MKRNQDNCILSQSPINLKQEIETKFQIVLTLSIFFPTLLSTFLNSAGVTKEPLVRDSLSWSFVVGLYLVDYVTFILLKNFTVSKKILGVVDNLLLLGIAFFIIPTINLATASANTPFLNRLDFIVFTGSLYGLPLAPVMLFALLSFLMFKKQWNFIIKAKKSILK